MIIFYDDTGKGRQGTKDVVRMKLGMYHAKIGNAFELQFRPLLHVKAYQSPFDCTRVANVKAKCLQNLANAQSIPESIGRLYKCCSAVLQKE